MKVQKFGAIWCSGCLVMKPIWAEIESEINDLITEYYDVDENEELVNKYKITDYPCFIWINKEGEEIHREYGEISKKRIIELCEKFKDE